MIACLDVRTNDAGDLVVTKGDQYDVREKEGAKDVRNLGKPVSLCADYYGGGADEVTFLNITAFRDLPLEDLPMLEVRSALWHRTPFHARVSAVISTNKHRHILLNHSGAQRCIIIVHRL